MFRGLVFSREVFLYSAKTVGLRLGPVVGQRLGEWARLREEVTDFGREDGEVDSWRKRIGGYAN